MLSKENAQVLWPDCKVGGDPPPVETLLPPNSNGIGKEPALAHIPAFPH